MLGVARVPGKSEGEHGWRRLVEDEMRPWLALLALVSLQAETPPGLGVERDGHRLVWSDEFEVPGRPDPNHWGYETGFVRNQEPQLYRPENATVVGGCLVIEARREHVANPDYHPGATDWRHARAAAEYTSASLTTRATRAWTYGRFEVRGRLEARRGMWPAFWFVGMSPGWPACGEVDLMEWYEDHLLANACWGPDPRQQHWSTTKRDCPTLAKLSAGRETPASWSAWSKAFHTWRMDWTAEQIELSVDGAPLNSIDVAAAKVGDRHPFRAPMHLILNLAVRSADHADQATFPARLEVDWVRVWKRP